MTVFTSPLSLFVDRGWLLIFTVAIFCLSECPTTLQAEYPKSFLEYLGLVNRDTQATQILTKFQSFGKQFRGGSYMDRFNALKEHFRKSYDFTTASGREAALREAKAIEANGFATHQFASRLFRDQLKSTRELTEQEIDKVMVFFEQYFLVDQEATSLVDIVAINAGHKSLLRNNSVETELPSAVPTDHLFNRKKLKLVDQWAWEEWH